MNPRIRLLYAEDNPHDADLTRSWFADYAPEFEIEVAATGQQCLERLREAAFDLLLLDYRLTDMLGLEVLRALNEAGSPMPVVMITGEGDEELVLKALRLGAANYSAKNSRYLESLPRLLHGVLEEHRRRQSQGLPAANLLRRILYVEHLTTDIDLTLAHFAKFAPHFVLDVVQSCAAALERLAQATVYDLLLVDLRMSDLSGLDFVHQAQARGLRLPPFLIISDRGGEAMAIAAMQLGAADYITKHEGYLDQLAYRIDEAIAKDRINRLNVQLLAELDLRKKNEARLRVADIALKTISQGVTLTGPDHRVIAVNHAFLAMTGYSTDEFIGQDCRFLQGPLTDQGVIAAIRRALHGDAHFSGEILNYRKEGGTFWNELSISPVRDEQGSLTHFIALSRDITERKRAYDELRIAAVAFAAQNMMIITDPHGIIQRVNPAFTHLTGYLLEETTGQTLAMLDSGRQGPLFYEQMWRTLEKKGSWQGVLWNRRKNGQIYADLLTITAVVNPAQQITNYVSIISDVSEDKEALAEIHRLAYYDPLTRLPNRRLLQDRLAQALIVSARNGLYGAILFIDLDNFKKLNDTRGHDTGDLLLVEVAQRLRETVRESDTVARQGGDEFVIVLEKLGTNADSAVLLVKQLGDKIRESIDRPFDLNGIEHHCRISIGVDLFDKHDTVEGLLKRADLALYQAKSEGRNALRFFEPAMAAALEKRSAMEAELRQALASRQLRLYYQPQFDASRQVIGAEALLRWQHPIHGLVPPLDFIPMAEDTGLILPIGQWVLETACALLKTLAGETQFRKLKIAVNVSAWQFRQADFVAQVQNVLQSSGVDPKRLKIELTESLALENLQDTIDKMLAIRQLGVGFSMDDFGTGYSCLAYLAQLPLDQLKIDQSFVRNLPQGKNDAIIARTVITMGRGLDMSVIAEGVETEAQHDFLRLHGCDAYQGYLFSRPLPSDEFQAFLRKA